MMKLYHPNILHFKESFWHPRVEGMVIITEYCGYGSLAGQMKSSIFT